MKFSIEDFATPRPWKGETAHDAARLEWAVGTRYRVGRDGCAYSPDGRWSIVGAEVRRHVRDLPPEAYPHVVTRAVETLAVERGA